MWSSIVQLVLRIAGLGVSYFVARWITDVMFDLGPVDMNRLAAEVIVYLLVATAALTISNILPIRRDLTRERDRGRRQERTRREQSRRNDSIATCTSRSRWPITNPSSTTSPPVHSARAGGAREILVADASRAHVHRSVVAKDRDARGCGVTTPGSCPGCAADRHSGSTNRTDSPPVLAFVNGNCPTMPSATCVPVTIVGRTEAVLHAVFDEAHDEDARHESVTELESIGISFGTRLGMLRAMAQSQLQADTDPLTGLLNRRAMENEVRQLHTEGTPFALAMADLDHFKQLNDTYGHDTGDRALRLFARVR